MLGAVVDNRFSNSSFIFCPWFSKRKGGSGFCFVQLISEWQANVGGLACSSFWWFSWDSGAIGSGISSGYESETKQLLLKGLTEEVFLVSSSLSWSMVTIEPFTFDVVYRKKLVDGLHFVSECFRSFQQPLGAWLRIVAIGVSFAVCTLLHFEFFCKVLCTDFAMLDIFHYMVKLRKFSLDRAAKEQLWRETPVVEWGEAL